MDLPKMIFFDTETTGFRPGNICQLSYLIIDGDNLIPKNHFFKVDYVEPGAERIHGLSVRKLAQLSENKTFRDHHNSLLKDFIDAELLVAHNFNFDLNFLRFEFRNCGQHFTYNDSLCTMNYFTDICKIPKSNGYGYKWPRLEELTRFFKVSERAIIKETNQIFECTDVGYHDARFDTVATYLCFMKAIEKGLVQFGTTNY